ncbi:hypothetical protein EJD96_14340 [Herbaspirillum seropedicae]|uniref:hypothetical protein n=1 Tax=Herbaspirillum seropedicae TaxID=964 RepID=UPI00112280CB|nr:hypothetical protein [Herbaspirillum seropedicae]QDD65253.1 hypothetical protein EJD96_14340 [Herbaspirillum seropedicae]
MHAAEMMLILLFLVLAYGGPFSLGYLYFRLRRTRQGAVPVAARNRLRSAALPLLCVVTLLLAYGLGHFRVLSYPGAVMLSMVLGAPVFFLSASLAVKASPPAPEDGH